MQQLIEAITETGQSEAARRAGVPRIKVNRFCNGRRPIRLDEAERLAAACGLEFRLVARKPARVG